MTEISATRQALRDYARAQVVVFTPQEGAEMPRAEQLALGEVAGKAFMALQAVLTICERLAKESVSQPITYHDDAHLIARGEDSREITKAIREALEG